MIQQCSNLFDILNVIYEQCSSSFVWHLYQMGKNVIIWDSEDTEWGDKKFIKKKKSKTDQLQHQQSAKM